MNWYANITIQKSSYLAKVYIASGLTVGVDMYRIPLKIEHHLCSCWGGAVTAIVLFIIQLHEIGLNLEFETLFTDFWQDRFVIQ